jgi:hypothetical protein
VNNCLGNWTLKCVLPPKQSYFKGFIFQGKTSILTCKQNCCTCDIKSDLLDYSLDLSI